MVRLLAPLALLLALSCGHKTAPSLKPLLPLPAPEGLQVSQRELSMSLTWQYPRDAPSAVFVIELNGQEVARLKAPPFNHRVSPGRPLTYTVWAQGPYSHSPKATLRVKAVLSPPQAPKGRFSIRGGQVLLAWSHPLKGISYSVYQHAEEGVKPLTEKPVREPRILLPASPYRKTRYLIRAVKEAPYRCEGPALEITILPEDFIPSRAHPPQVVPTARGTVLLWKENPEPWVKGYRIYRKTPSEKEFRPIGESPVPTLTDPEAPPGARYRITALGPATEGPPSEEQ